MYQDIREDFKENKAFVSALNTYCIENNMILLTKELLNTQHACKP